MSYQQLACYHAAKFKTLPSLVDEKARQSPSQPFASIPTQDWRVTGWQDVTFSQAARAIDALAYWLVRNADSIKSRTIAYFGPNDLRYAFVVFAAVKANYCILLPDIMSSKALLSLFSQAGCSTVVVSENCVPMITEIIKIEPQLSILTIPSVEELLSIDHNAIPFRYERTFDEVKDEDVFITHTSGTTGNPKPISQTHTTLALTSQRWDLMDEPLGGRLSISLLMKCRVLTTYPLFWLAGIWCVTLWPAAIDMVPVLLPVDAPQPLTAQYIDEIHQHAAVSCGAYTPSIIYQLCKIPEAKRRLQNFDSVIYTGAKLDAAVGSMLSAYTEVHGYYGSTEMSGFPYYLPDDRVDWMYYRFHPMSGVRMEPIEDEDYYELVIDRHEKLEGLQVVFLHFPDLHIWRSHDLFSPHPSKPDLWRAVGRIDDLVKTSWLAKFHAYEVEARIEASPLVRSALLGGEGRESPFLIVDLMDDDAVKSPGEKLEFLHKIWQVVEDANKEDSQLIQIRRDKILIPDTGRPFPRTHKGTVKRHEVLETYAGAIDALYM